MSNLKDLRYQAQFHADEAAMSIGRWLVNNLDENPEFEPLRQCATTRILIFDQAKSEFDRLRSMFDNDPYRWDEDWRGNAKAAEEELFVSVFLYDYHHPMLPKALPPEMWEPVLSFESIAI